MSARVFLALSLALSGCGDDALPGDGGVDAPPVERCARLGDPPSREALLACGVCIEPHAHVVSTARSIGQLYPVRGGVIVSYNAPFHHVVLINDAGELVGTAYPYAGEVGEFGGDGSFLVPVPESNRVWAVNNLRYWGTDRSLDRSDLVLFEWSLETGLTQLAAASVQPFVGEEAIALDTGELLAGLSGFDETGRPLRKCEAVGEDVECVLFDEVAGWVEAAWAIEGGAAIMTRPSQFFLGDASMYLVGPDGRLLSEPVRIDAEDSDAYEIAPGVHTQHAVVVHKDRSAAVILRGTLAGMNASPRGHYFLRRIDSRGVFLDEAPGIFLNPDAFASATDQPEILVTGGLITAPNGAVFAHWPIEEGIFQYSQIIEPDGTFRLPTSRYFRVGGDEFGIPAMIDDDDIAYQPTGWLTETNPDRPFEGASGIDRLNDNLEFVWPEPVAVQRCARVDETPIAHIEAESGVWFAWEDVVIGAEDGLEYTLLKLTHVLPDRSFGWGNE